jgi:hypothetical protein
LTTKKTRLNTLITLNLLTKKKQTEITMNTEQLQNALKAAQEAVNILTELIEGQQSEPTTLEMFNIYPLDKSEYPEVKRVLQGVGYKLYGGEWMEGEDCVTTTDDGYHMTHHYSKLKRLNDPTYTFAEFMTKFAK